MYKFRTSWIEENRLLMVRDEDRWWIGEIYINEDNVVTNSQYKGKDFTPELLNKIAIDFGYASGIDEDVMETIKEGFVFVHDTPEFPMHLFKKDKVNIDDDIFNMWIKSK